LQYFADDLFGRISFTDLSVYKNETFTAFRKLVEKSDAENSLDELLELILRVGRYSSPQSFFNLNKGLLLIDNKKQLYAHAQWVHDKLVENVDFLSKNTDGGLEPFLGAF